MSTFFQARIVLLSAVFLLFCSSCIFNKVPTSEPDLVVGAVIPSTATPPPPYFVTVEAAGKMNTGFHSFAEGEYGGYLVVVGGRKNGFHGTAGSNSKFPRAAANDSLYVIDLSTINDEKVKLYAAILPASVRGFLSASNMGYEQMGDYLFTSGGYGTTCANGVYTDSCYQTFPYLTRIDLASVVSDVTAGNPVKASAFIQKTNDAFRVTGGELYEIDGTFSLVFGQNYPWVYKAGRTGIYTEQILSFQVTSTKDDFTVSKMTAVKDPTGATGTESQFHRRDLNVVPGIRANGQLGLDVYGGVFNGSDGAYQQPISIDGSKTVVHPDSLIAGLYECGQVLIYDQQNLAMYTTLLGGIGSQRYDSNGKLVPDASLPFVKTISTVTHDRFDNVKEYVQPASQKLPSWIGANGVFVTAQNVTTMQQHKGIIDLNALPTTTGRQLIGHLVGGIHAAGSSTGGGVGSYADNVVYKVYLTRQ